MKLKCRFYFNITISKIGQIVQTVPIFSKKRLLETISLCDLSITDILKASVNSMIELYSMHFRYEVPDPNRYCEYVIKTR